jgi:hypothetical protein
MKTTKITDKHNTFIKRLGDLTKNFQDMMMGAPLSG